MGICYFNGREFIIGTNQVDPLMRPSNEGILNDEEVQSKGFISKISEEFLLSFPCTSQMTKPNMGTKVLLNNTFSQRLS
jgi:hypothetical protein